MGVDVFLNVLMILLVCSLIILARNERVSQYRARLLSQVSRAAKDDIKKDMPWKWRYDVFDSVSYEQMLFKFWKPLKSFYKDASFLTCDTTDPNVPL